MRERWEDTSARTRDAKASFTTSPRGSRRSRTRRRCRARAAVGFEYPDLAGAVADLDDELRELRAELPQVDPPGERAPDERAAAELGDVLFAVVNVARRLNVDPELELRAAAQRFRARVEAAEKLAAADGEEWTKLSLADQDAYYDRAKELA